MLPAGPIAGRVRSRTPTGGAAGGSTGDTARVRDGRRHGHGHGDRAGSRLEEGLDDARRAAGRTVAHLEERAHELADRVKPRLRGVLHEAAFAVSLVTGTALVSLADGGRARVAALVYALSVALLFGTSAAYHRGSWSGRSYEVMKRLDHSMIFVLIAGTYTPFALLLLEGGAQLTVLAVVWGGALVGIVLRVVVRRPARWLFVALYNLLGWVAVAFLPQILDAGGLHVMLLLLAGGLLYSAGAVVYALRRPDPSPRWFGFHEVFHAFTLAAFVVHYVAVSFTTYGFAA
jgi:hemolysin III